MARAISAGPHRTAQHRWGVELRILWGDRILGEHFLHAGVDRTFRMGSAAGVDFAMSTHLFDVESFDVVTVRSGRFELHFTGKMPGTLWRHGDAQQVTSLIARRAVDELRDGVYATELSWGEAACFEFGPLRLEIVSRRAPQRVIVPLEDRVDFAFLSVAMLMFLIGAGFVTTALTADLDEAYADDLSPAQNARIIRAVIDAPKTALNNPILRKHEKKKQQMAEAAKKPAGQAGAIDVSKKQQPAMANSHRESAKELASKIFGKGSGAILGAVDLKMKEALGGLTGETFGLAPGFGGLAIKGGNNGGGGDGELQRIGDMRKGRGGGVGYPCDDAKCLGLIPGRKKVTDIVVGEDPPTIIGSLDRELIRQVIHAHRSQIRYCYETELNRAPNLSGKISIKFVINASGAVAVSQVASTTMNNATVESCVAGRVRTWIFPKPKGGGQVVVQYPFVFKAAGQ